VSGVAADGPAVSEVAVRPATPADAATVAALLGHLGYPAPAGAIPARLVRMRAKGDAEALVAAIASDVVGLATVHARDVLHHDVPVVQLTALVVPPERRGLGVGRALVDAVLAWAAARGADRLVVTTALHRAEAPRFYERLGFEHTGRRYVRWLAERESAAGRT
jgi:GNAT superfamily N-acetyltransferase